MPLRLRSAEVKPYDPTGRAAPNVLDPGSGGGINYDSYSDDPLYRDQFGANLYGDSDTGGVYTAQNGKLYGIPNPDIFGQYFGGNWGGINWLAGGINQGYVGGDWTAPVTGGGEEPPPNEGPPQPPPQPPPPPSGGSGTDWWRQHPDVIAWAATEQGQLWSGSFDHLPDAIRARLSASGGDSGSGNTPKSPYVPGTYNPSSGGAYGKLINPAFDLRSYQLNPVDYSKSRDYYSQALGSINKLKYSPYKAVAPTDTSGAKTLYDKALGQAGEANISGFSSVAGTDSSRVKELLNRVMGMTQGVEMSNPIYNPSAESGRSRELLMQALEKLASAPNREEMAAKALALGREETEPQYQKSLRDVGYKAGSLGRIGAGMTTNELTDVFLTRERDMDRLQKSLGLEAASMTMSDLLGRLGATSGVAGQFRSEDLAEADFRRGLDRDRIGLEFDKADRLRQSGFDDFSINRTLRDEQVQERDALRANEESRSRLAMEKAGFTAGMGDKNLSLAQILRGDSMQEREVQTMMEKLQNELEMERSGAYTSAGDREAGFAQSDYANLFGERDYQNQAAQQAFENELTRILTENQMTQADFNRWLEKEKFRSTLG